MKEDVSDLHSVLARCDIEQLSSKQMSRAQCLLLMMANNGGGPRSFKFSRTMCCGICPFFGYKAKCDASFWIE